MKNYKITVKDKKTKQIKFEFTELSNTLKYVNKKYKARFMFENPPVIVTVKRLIRPLGVQLNLLDQK